MNHSLSYSNKEYLIYNQYCAKYPDNKPGLIFLGGFKSDMNGTKAMAITEYAKKNNYDLIKFDYFGHGESSGKFIDGTISIWLENTLMVIDQLVKNKPQILIGSSMGGWLMLLAALARPEKIAGLVGLAGAPDFTEELIWDEMTIEQRRTIEKDGIADFSNEFCQDSYPIALNLILDARKHLLLDKAIPINVPVRLIHGMSDEDVPYSTAIRIIERLTSQDAQLHLIKNAGHRLSEAKELEVIYKVITELGETTSRVQ